jgi:hypothetical protein
MHFETRRQMRLTILLSLIVSISFAQQSSLDLNSLEFKGFGLKTTKKEIKEQFGQGKTVATNYECGFFTNDQPGGPYYQLTYSNFVFIGSDNDAFYLQSVDFDSKGVTILNYGNKIFSGTMTKAEFVDIFGDIAKEHFKNPKNDKIVLIAHDRDDGARFWFKDGRLVRFEYWTPC